MKLAIMQPYLFPYLGYFQLIEAVDTFIIYDNIEYTKKGWINRNRLLLNGKDHLFTIPIRKDSDHLHVNQRYLPENTQKDIKKILAQIHSAYSKAPQFSQVYPLIEQIFLQPERNLFHYIYHSVEMIKQYLGIMTPLVISSKIGIDHALKGKDKVLALCHAMKSDTYINPIGGVGLYDKQEFKSQGVNLLFHQMNDLSYQQGANPFIKSLSIIDVMMFNSRDAIHHLLTEFTLT